MVNYDLMDCLRGSSQGSKMEECTSPNILKNTQGFENVDTKKGTCLITLEINVTSLIWREHLNL